GQVLIVAHAGVNRVILCHILGMPLANLFRLGQDYGGLNIIDGKNNSMYVKAMNVQPSMNKIN
nr:histidine phosphatase family protein [Deltaproteobacteria bacterium]